MGESAPPERQGSGTKLRVAGLFPTLIGETECPEASGLNPELAAYIRDRERDDRDYSMFTTVNNGWQSAPDVFDADVEPLRALKRFIDDQLKVFLYEWGRVSFRPSAELRFRPSYTAWAIILRQGGFQHEHIHRRTDVSGVYYVEVPDGAGDQSPGDLTFVDPRAGRLASRAGWEVADYSSRPRSGKLVLFPSFLPHRVDQMQTAGERLSINFDISLQPVPESS